MSTKLKLSVVASVAAALSLTAGLLGMTSTAATATSTSPSLVGTPSGDTINYTYTNQMTQDSSTCGNNWANDTVTRVFHVYPEKATDLSFRVVENYTGKFVTIQGPSAGACETSPGPNGNGSLISANVKGVFHGSVVIKVANGVYSPSEDVPAPCAASTDQCFTSSFVTAAFGASATIATEPDFYFKYTTATPTACAKKWINAGTGNSGDIATICNAGPAGASAAIIHSHI